MQEESCVSEEEMLASHQEPVQQKVTRTEHFDISTPSQRSVDVTPVGSLDTSDATFPNIEVQSNSTVSGAGTANSQWETGDV